MKYHPLAELLFNNDDWTREGRDKVIRTYLSEKAKELKKNIGAYSVGCPTVDEILDLSSDEPVVSDGVGIFICEYGHTHKADGCPGVPKQKSLAEKLREATYPGCHESVWYNLDWEKAAKVAEAHYAEGGK